MKCIFLLLIVCTLNALPTSDRMRYFHREVRETSYVICNNVECPDGSVGCIATPETATDGEIVSHVRCTGSNGEVLLEDNVEGGSSDYIQVIFLNDGKAVRKVVCTITTTISRNMSNSFKIFLRFC